MKPTLEQFKDYLRIRDSGITNMFDIWKMTVAVEHEFLIRYFKEEHFND